MKNPLSALKDKVTQYIQLKFELIRLEVIERLVNVMGYFAFVIIAIFLFFLLGFFVFMGIASVLGEALHSPAMGYFATAGIILVLVILIVLCSRFIIRLFAGRMVAMLTKPKRKQEANDDDEEN